MIMLLSVGDNVAGSTALTAVLVIVATKGNQDTASQDTCIPVAQDPYQIATEKR